MPAANPALVTLDWQLQSHQETRNFCLCDYSIGHDEHISLIQPKAKFSIKKFTHPNIGGNGAQVNVYNIHVQ